MDPPFTQLGLALGFILSCLIVMWLSVFGIIIPGVVDKFGLALSIIITGGFLGVFSGLILDSIYFKDNNKE